MALPNPLPSVDDAYASFKTLEGTLTSAQAAKQGTAASLLQAQNADTSAATDLATATANALEAAQVLDAAVQALEATLQPPAPPAA